MREFVRLRRPEAPTRVVARSLPVGRANDPAERDAEATSERVMAWLAARQRPSAGPASMSPASTRIRRTTAPSVVPDLGPDGGAVSADLEHRIRSGRGRPLDAATQARFEPAFGTSFGDVRVHADSDVAPRLGARAFTLGTDVHFAPGAYRPDSPDGARTLAHELTHVVQQRGRDTGTSRAIRRDVGFEFESRQFSTRRTNDGGGGLPAVAFADAGVATGAFNGVGSSRIAKSKVILDQADIEVQADDAGGSSDLEAVTTHFPETPNGRARLDQATTRLGQLIARGDALQVGHLVTAKALSGTAGFTSQMPDGIIFGDWNTATTAPQVTLGVRLGNIGDIVKDLHGRVNEKAGRKTMRAGGRLHMRRAKGNDATKPSALTTGSEAKTLVDGHRLAVQTLRAFRQADANAPGGPELEGFLTIIYTYIEAAARKNSFLKSHTPLMAKTNLATAWETLPANVQTYYGETVNKGVTRFERLVASAPGYAAKMSRPVFDVDPTTKMFDETTSRKKSGAPKAKQWYHKLTLRSWVRAIAVHRDTTVGEAVSDFFTGQQRGVDQLTTAHFPGRPDGQQIEGYGALDAHMDTDVTTQDDLPVFELRSATKQITFADARQWSLDVFDYIRSLNANPGGAHQRM